jgi:hypothetical protein
MGEGVGETPEQPAEPSEEELRAMLEKREQVQATQQHRLARIGTRFLMVVFAAAAIAFFSSSENREAAASMFREPEPAPAPPPKPAMPAKSGGAPETVEEQLIRGATDATTLSSPDGKMISKEDIGLAVEILNFMQGPPPREEPPAEEKAKGP